MEKIKKQKLVHVNPLHAANVAGLMYVVMGVLYAIGFFFLSPLDPEMIGITLNMRIIISLVMLFGIPLFGWLMVLISTWFANLFLKLAGGIELTFKS